MLPDSTEDHPGCGTWRPGIDQLCNSDFSVDARPVVHLASWKKHISIYPIPELDENLELQLAPYLSGKGTVKIPMEKPIPYELITVLVERLVTQRH